MPRYFFDVHDDIDLTDDKGVELRDIEAARREAARALAEAAKDILPADGANKELSITVRDESGAVVLHTALRFSSTPEF